MKTLPALGTSLARPADSVVARMARPLPSFMPHAPTAVKESAAPISLALACGKVHRIDRTDDVREIQVLSGVLWLTTTPAEGDVLLRKGERFSISGSWPIVFEALKDASVRVV